MQNTEIIELISEVFNQTKARNLSIRKNKAAYAVVKTINEDGLHNNRYHLLEDSMVGKTNKILSGLLNELKTRYEECGYCKFLAMDEKEKVNYIIFVGTVSHPHVSIQKMCLER